MEKDRDWERDRRHTDWQSRRNRDKEINVFMEGGKCGGSETIWLRNRVRELQWGSEGRKEEMGGREWKNTIALGVKESKEKDICFDSFWIVSYYHDFLFSLKRGWSNVGVCGCVPVCRMKGFALAFCHDLKPHDWWWREGGRLCLRRRQPFASAVRRRWSWCLKCIVSTFTLPRVRPGEIQLI